MKIKAQKKSAATKVKATSKAAAATPEKVTPTKVAAQRERRDIEPSQLVAAPWNPRGDITPESVADLAASIATVGIIEPVVVMPGDGAFIIIAGHRRVKAAIVAGLATIPCDVLTGVDEAQARRMTFIENLQRKDADPLLEAELVGNLMADGMTQAEIAAETGRGEKWVARRANLVNLSASWRKRLAAGERIAIECLEHVAAYPQALQEHLRKSGEWESRRNNGQLRWPDIRREFVNEVRDLKEAIFDCSKCYQCAKNSGCTPDLFDYDGGKNPALGRCLDAACYKRRRNKHVADTLEAAKASCVTIIKDDPRYTGIKTSPTKTSKCRTLYTWQSYDGETQILWAEAPKKKTAAETKQQEAYDEKIAAERKEKRERNKAIRKLAEWCGGGTAGEPCNLAKLLDDRIERQPYTNSASPFAVFAIQHAFYFVGWSSWKLVGTNTEMRDCAISALFGNLTVPAAWTSRVAAEIINSLNPSRGGGWQAERNAVLILHMLGADAADKVGADIVAAIVPENDDAGKSRDPQVKWLGEGEECEPCDDDSEEAGSEEGGAE